jgi:hypothetical protein
MDADLGTRHAPEAAGEVMDKDCRQARERGQIDIVRSGTCVDKADKRTANRRIEGGLTASCLATRSIQYAAQGSIGACIIAISSTELDLSRPDAGLPGAMTA